MRAVDHIAEFIPWVITDADAVCHEVRLPKGRLVALYLEWARRRCILPLPEKTLLTLLGKHAQVKRDRKRKKDSKGRVLRTATEARSPQRDRIYILSPPRAEPVLPGKVPLAPLVEARPVLTKKQREARRAALGAPQDGLDIEPLRRAA